MKIRTHDYAKHAYPLVESIKGSEIESKYRTLALNFPIMIMQSGLAQAIGFLMAKNKAEHQKLLVHVANLLNKKDDKTLHNEILSSDITQYQLLTRKALDASGWLKRYTEALLDKDAKVGTEDSKVDADAQDETQEQTIEQEIEQNIAEPNT